MKWKLFLVLVVLVFSLIAAFVLVACNDNSETQTSTDDSKLTYNLMGDMLPKEGVIFSEGDDLMQIYQSSSGLNEKIGNGSAVIEFKDENGKIVSGAAPRSNVTATLKEVVIGNNVSSISNSAFKGCTSLTSVTIGDGVTSIGSNAFDGCTAEINWGNNPTIETIGSNAFSGYKGTSITIPNSVTSIGYNAFYGCDSLTSVTIPDGVTSIGYGAFDYCASLTSVTIPDSVTSIGDAAFGGCTYLTIYCEAASKPSGWDNIWNYNGCPVVWDANNSDVADDGNIYYIDENGLRYTLKDTTATVIIQPKNLSGDIEIPASVSYKGITYSVTSIGEDAFYNCDSLTSVTIGDSVTSIGYGAFAYCDSLTSVTIGDGVTSIGSYAFEDCTSLKSVNIPYSVLYIGYKAFYNSKNTTTIYIGLPSTPSGWNSSWYGSGIKIVYDKTMTSGSDSNYNYYILDDGIYLTEYIGSNTVVEIPEYIDGKKVVGLGSIFESNTTVTSVTIPDGIKAIPYRMFYGCTSLTSVTIPDSVTSIGSSAFSGCTSLTSITIPDSITSIGSYAFEDCTSLANVYYKSDVSSWLNIDFNSYNSNPLFYGAKLYLNGKLATDIVISDSVTSIGDYAFINCTSLTSVTIPDSVTSIGYRAFGGCDSLTSVIIPDSVTSIGDWAYGNCKSLNDVYYTSDIASWLNISFGRGSANPLSNGANLYLNGELATDIVIPDSVTSIGIAFYGCTSLTSVTIPDSVTSIGDSAFRGCTYLTIYCEAASKPSGWDNNWNDSGCPVVWDSKNSDVADDGNIYYIDENGLRYVLKDTTATVVSQAKNLSGNIEIPASVSYKDNVYSVTSIVYRAFSGCTSLTSVTIGDGVTSIGSSAFSGCTSLTSVTIPDSVTSIGYSAFYGCNSLTIYCEAASKPSGWDNNWNDSGCPVVWDANNSDVADDGNIYYIDENGLRYALKDTTATVVIQPKNLSGNIEITASVSYKDNVYSVTSIVYRAFSGCTSLTSVTIGDGVTSIGSSAFSGCTSLTSVTIPDSVTSIGNGVFSGCTSLETITVDSSNSVYHGAGNCLIETATKTLIAGCKNSVIPDDGSVTSIGDEAFYNCTSLTSVTIPDSVTSIGDEAFAYCSSLTSVTIGDGVTSIGRSAFAYCSSLTSVAIGDSVTSIGSYAFRGCTGLTEINWNAVSVKDFTPNSDVFYNAGKEENGITVTFGDNVQKIPAYAFYNCTSLTSVTIGDSVTSIGDGAFRNCTSLTSVTIGDGVTSIGDYAFDDTPYYKNLPDGEVYLGKVLYEYRGNMPANYTANVKDGTVSISPYAFSGCTSLTSVTIPDSVTSIGDYAFVNCDSLTSVTIPDSVMSIGRSAFSNCTSLTSVTIPNSVTSIGSNAFRDCTSLSSVTIPDSVTSIGDYAFQYCTLLTSVTFEGTVAQWNAISKGINWIENMPFTEVVCLDGTGSGW